MNKPNPLALLHVFVPKKIQEKMNTRKKEKNRDTGFNTNDYGIYLTKGE